MVERVLWPIEEGSTVIDEKFFHLVLSMSNFKILSPDSSMQSI